MMVKYLDTQVNDDAIAAVVREVAAAYRRQYVTTAWGEKAKGRKDAADIVYKAKAKASRVVTVDANGMLVFTFKFDADLKNSLKANVPGRSWDSVAKVWTAPVTHEAIAWAMDNEFSIPSDLPEPVEAEVESPATTTNAVMDGGLVVVDTPFDRALVNAMRDTPGRSWDNMRKVNVFKPSPAVRALLDEFALTYTDEVAAACGQPDAPADLSHLSDADALPEGVVLEDEGIDGLYGFQKVAVKYAQEAGNRVLIGDQMGLGKTREAIAIIEAWRRSA